MKRSRWQYLVLTAAWFCAAATHAQQSLAEAARLQPHLATHVLADDATAPAATLEDALHGMFSAAEVVFAGTVTRVEKTDQAVIIRFHVEDGVRGVATGATYTLREWSGLWVDDPDRYMVGERRLMLLHALSQAGYASPVAGSRGAIRLHGNAAQDVADLRWVATNVVQAVSSPSIRALASAEGKPASSTAGDNSAVDGSMLSGMLHAWQRSEAAR